MKKTTIETIEERTELQPLSDRLIVQKEQVEEKSPGGIYLPDNAKEKPQQGVVLACGPGKLDDKGGRMPMEIEVGMIILFAKYAGTEVKIEGEEYLILGEKDVLAIVRKTGANE